MAEIEKHSFDVKEQLDQDLAEEIAKRLQAAIDERGRAVLVVSGGSTPAGLFRRLSGAALDWPKVTITLADERWLAPDHKDSNERLIREQLLVNKASSAAFLSLTTSAGSPDQALDDIQQRLSELGSADVLVLGMCGDGHTASLFPQATNLEQGLAMDGTRHCIAIDPVTAPYPRMSMTLPRLLDSRHIVVHITGESKREVFERACENTDPRKAPISAVLNEAGQTVHLYWAP